MKKSIFLLMIVLAAEMLPARMPQEGSWGMNFSLAYENQLSYENTVANLKESLITTPSLGMLFGISERINLNFSMNLDHVYLIDQNKDTYNRFSILASFYPLFTGLTVRKARFLTGPCLEAKFTTIRTQTQSTGVVNTSYLIVISLGVITATQYFVLPYLSVGISSPFLLNLPIYFSDANDTNSTPFSFETKFPQKIQLDFTYYF